MPTVNCIKKPKILKQRKKLVKRNSWNKINGQKSYPNGWNRKKDPLNQKIKL